MRPRAVHWVGANSDHFAGAAKNLYPYSGFCAKGEGMKLLRYLATGLTTPAHLATLRSRSVVEGIGYLTTFLLFVLYAAALYFAAFMYGFKGTVETYQAAVLEELDIFYPRDLVLTWTNGELSTNGSEPIVLDPKTSLLRAIFPFSGKSGTADHSVEHLLTIDTSAAAEQFENYKSVFLLTKRSAVSLDDDGNNRMTFYKEGDTPMNTTFTQRDFAEYAAIAKPIIGFVGDFYLALIVACALVLPLIVLLFWLLWHLVYLLVASFIAWIVAALCGRSLRYSEVYVLALHASAWPILLVVAVSIASLTLPMFSFSLILLAMLILTFLAIPKRTHSTPQGKLQ